MSRSIVLRFDATCFDCGRPLSAGSTAKWFGKGRVSCCGAATPVAQPVTPVTAPPAQHQTIPPYLPSRELASLSTDVGIPIENLASGLTREQAATLAIKAPRQRLLVRLSSGARFIVPAEHALHVIRCVEESLVDRVRDVALLAESGR